MSNTDRRDTSVLTTFFGHNAWANRKLLEFCENLSDEQLAATAIGGFGSIRETLVHSIRAEVSYVNRVNGKQPPRSLDGDAFPGFAALKEAADWAGEELLQLALSAQKSAIVRQRPPRPRIEYPLASLIMQALTHSTEHRTQIATVITQLGLEPPDMSGWNYMEQTGELHQLDEAANDA